ncbi:hypothetical protein WJX82_003235 [Trebouxia sp. C0006]
MGKWLLPEFVVRQKDLLLKKQRDGVQLSCSLWLEVCRGVQLVNLLPLL